MQEKIKDDTISRQAAIEVFADAHPLDYNAQAYLAKIRSLPSAQPEPICVAKVTLTDEQVKEAVEKAKCEILTVLSAEPEITMCKDCIYYDPPHIEKDGQRYEYKDMPPEAFDPFTKKYVNSSYGINIGGRCCRDYECGYSEDKRVYVPETNYCGRAERKEE